MAMGKSDMGLNLFWRVYLHLYRICAKGWAKGYGGLWGEDLEWGRVKCASLYRGSSVWDGSVVVWCVSVDTTILHVHTFLSAPACTACTNMVYSKELGRDVTTTAKALLRPQTLAPFLHRTWSVHFLTSEGQIRAVMYMPCVKCACSELKLVKHLHIFFVLA